MGVHVCPPNTEELIYLPPYWIIGLSSRKQKDLDGCAGSPIVPWGRRTCIVNDDRFDLAGAVRAKRKEFAVIVRREGIDI